MAAATTATSMALGLAMYAPPATVTQGRARLEPQGSKARVSGRPVAAISTSGRLRVRALPDDGAEAEISSVRDDHANLFQRIVDWGRHQMLTLFSELADGSLLISFGEVASTNSVPARPPSRFSKQLPYAKLAKQIDPLASTSHDLTVEQMKPPVRAPSTFSKKSPVARTSERHRQREKKSPGFPAEPQSTEGSTSFQDSQQTLKAEKTSRNSRPKGFFARKSPVPQATKHMDRRKKGKTQDLKKEQEQDGRSAREAEYAGSTERRDVELNRGKGEEVPSKDLKKQLVSVLESHSDQFREAEAQEQHGPKQAEAEVPPKQRLRPRGVFVRKSPITADSLLRSSRRRRRTTKAATDAQVNQAVVVAVVKEEAKLLATELEAKPVATARVEATVEEAEEFSRAAKSTRRRRKIVVESEFECSDIEEVDGSIDNDVDLSSLTIARLRGIAKSKGLRGYSRLKKAELVALLLNQQ